MWSSAWTRERAVASFGEARVATLDDRRVPPGANAGALAGAWSSHIDGRRNLLQEVDGKPTIDALLALVRSINRTIQVVFGYHAFTRELAQAPRVNEDPLGSDRVNIRALLGEGGGAEGPDESRATAEVPAAAEGLAVGSSRRSRSRSLMAYAPHL